MLYVTIVAILPSVRPGWPDSGARLPPRSPSPLLASQALASLGRAAHWNRLEVHSCPRSRGARAGTRCNGSGSVGSI